MPGPARSSSSSVYWASLVSFVLGGVLSAIVLVIVFAPTIRQINRTAAYVKEQEKVWGHHRTEAPETISKCAADMSKLHTALLAYEKPQGHLPVGEGTGCGVIAKQFGPYVKDRKLFVCPADPTRGTHYGTKQYPNSRLYTYSGYWVETNQGRYLALKPDSPLLICRHHPGVLLILRYNGLVEVAPESKYKEIKAQFAQEQRAPSGAPRGSDPTKLSPRAEERR